MYNVNYTTSYAFNLAGEVTTMTYPSGRVVKHEYDAIGRVANVKNNATQANYASGAAYSAAGQITGFSYGNSVTAAMGYSAQRLQLTSLSYAQGGTTHLSLAYGYSQGGNNNGQVASVTDSSGETGAGGRTVNYTYDSLHRLLTAQTTGSAQYPQWGLSWTYDRFGNRSAQTVTAGSGPSNSVTIDAATNRITAMGGYTFYYDANGNLTQDDLYKYKYDAESRLVEVRLLNNTLVSTYAFDGKSLRISKVVGADRTMYVYAGTEMISEYEDAASNTYSPGTTPGQAGSDSTGVLLYQHGDHLTTRVTTENSGALSNRQGHFPYGESWYEALTANPSVLRKYTTYLRDDETTSGKLNYAVFRQHSARTGRFLMADPVRGRVRIPQRLNRFVYAGGDPTNRRDRLGRDWEPSDCAVDPNHPKCSPLLMEADPSHPWTAEYYFTGWPYPYSPWNPPGLPFDMFGMPTGDPFGLPDGWGGGGGVPCNSFLPGGCPIGGGGVGPGTGADCTDNVRNSPGATGNQCEGLKPPHKFLDEWSCTGDVKCCREKMRKYINGCYDRGPGHVVVVVPPLFRGMEGQQCCKAP